MDELADVVVARARTYDEFRMMLPEAVSALGGVKIRAEKVAIKINLCDARTPDTGAITHPASLDALLWLLREHMGFEGDIYVMEGDSGSVLADQYARWFGFTPVLERWAARWLNITKARGRPARIDGRVLKAVRVPEELEGAFFVSSAKLKTNVITKLTGALKNQFGCLHVIYKARFHPWIDEVIADLNTVFRPDLSIVDGVIAHVGTKGPAFGAPVRAGVFVMGRDPVATDATCARLLGFRPSSIGHLRECARRGLGRLSGFRVAYLGFNGPGDLPRLNCCWDPLEALAVRWLDRLRALRRGRAG